MGRSTYVEGLSRVFAPLKASTSEPDKELQESVLLDVLSPPELGAQISKPTHRLVELIDPPSIGIGRRKVQHVREDLLDLLSKMSRSGSSAGMEERGSSMVAESFEDLLLVLHVSTANLTVWNNHLGVLGPNDALLTVLSCRSCRSNESCGGHLKPARGKWARRVLQCLSRFCPEAILRLIVVIIV